MKLILFQRKMNQILKPIKRKKGSVKRNDGKPIRKSKRLSKERSTIS